MTTKKELGWMTTKKGGWLDDNQKGAWLDDNQERRLAGSLNPKEVGWIIKSKGDWSWDFLVVERYIRLLNLQGDHLDVYGLPCG